MAIYEKRVTVYPGNGSLNQPYEGVNIMALGTDGVFKRVGEDTLSRRVFYLVLAAILTWGFYATSVVAGMTSDWHPNIWTLLAVGLGIPILGICLSSIDNAFISFIGFNMVVVPIGAIMGPALVEMEVASPGIVSEAAKVTAGVTAVMGFSGVLFPNFYRNLGGALFTALLCLLGAMVVSMFVPSLNHLGIVNWLGAGLFALYIGYDMHRASEIPATLDNAVDVAVSLYLDVINFFLQYAGARTASD